jgi:hypothetical protein
MDGKPLSGIKKGIDTHHPKIKVYPHKTAALCPENFPTHYLVIASGGTQKERWMRGFHIHHSLLPCPKLV